MIIFIFKELSKISGIFTVCALELMVSFQTQNTDGNHPLVEQRDITSLVMGSICTPQLSPNLHKIHTDMGES